MPKKTTGSSRTTKTTKKKVAKAKTAKPKTAKAKAKTTKKAPRAAAKPTTAPAAAPAEAKTRPAAERLRVRQVRSGIGHAATYRRTLRALGLKHHQDEIVVRDTPSVRGALHKVRHLVRVTREEA